MSRTLERFVRYTFIGVSTFLIDLVILFVLASIFSINYLVAVGAGFFLAVSLNYFLSREFAFKYSDRSVMSGYAYFLKFAFVGMIVTITGVAFLVTYAEVQYLLARVVVAVAVGMANYAANLFINFKVAGKDLR